MFENKTTPVISAKAFRRRFTRSIALCFMILLFSLLIGTIGYHFICDLPWIDSIYNASMILTGMGPVNCLAGDAAKLFASFYAIFSGVAFLTTIGVILAPVIHRVIHKFHFDDQD